jgi:hypothetical protein
MAAAKNKIVTKTNLLSSNEILFDSISIHFSMYIFIKQFFIHLTAPFFIYLGNPVNQNFFNLSWGPFMYNSLSSIVVYIMIVSAVVQLHLSNTDIEYATTTCFWMPLIYYTLHKFQNAILLNTPLSAIRI